jgi:glycosyltransferase involved in cell wall biosynthesis
VRIAHIGSKGLPAKGGTERVVEAVARRHAHRHEVTVYGDRSQCATGMYHGVRVVAVRALEGKHVGPASLQMRAAVEALTRERYDVVHVHGSENGFVVPLLRWRYPVVTTGHGPAYDREKWGRLARKLIQANEPLSVLAASCPTAVAATQARELSRRYRRTVVHVPNGVDVPAPASDGPARAFLAGLGLEAGRFVLFAAARVDPTKGCHTLMEACHLLPAPPPVLVVGDLHHAPGYEQTLRTLAGGLPVTFVPRLEDGAVLGGLLRTCRAFVFPSTVEAMSMMLLEALAQGAVALVSDIPENADVVPPEYPTFRADDPASLARELEIVLTLDEAQRVSVGDLGRAWVERWYGWDRIADRYEELYRRAVEAHRRRGP